MRISCITIGQDGELKYETGPDFSKNLDNDGVFRWLNVEAATREELEFIFNQLGTEGEEITEHILGDTWFGWPEGTNYFVKPCAAPTAWTNHETWYHMVGLRETVVTVHAAEIPLMESFIKRWWLGRPGPDRSAEALMLHVIQCFVEEENFEFSRLRLKIEEHAEGLRIEDESYSAQDLELMMTDCNHMSTVLFEYQILFEGVEFSRSKVILLDNHVEQFRTGASAVKTMREGVEQIQRRLDELMQQHIMDQQKRADSRLRVLTIISAIFLPLTLIAGIYGMNFENMPELRSENSYFIVLFVMIAVAAGSIGFFIRKGWFK